MRQMTLVAFLQAQNCTNLAMSWRHPQSRTDSWSPDYYRHIGRVLEQGKFHLGFFDKSELPELRVVLTVVRGVVVGDSDTGQV